jgi:hypothetical protein
MSLLDDQTKSFISLIGKSNVNTVIVSGILSATIPYQVYYCKYNDFGKENVEVLPISFNYLFEPSQNDKYMRMIDCNNYNNKLLIRRINENAMMWIDLFCHDISVKMETITQSSVRGYDAIELKLEPGYKSKNKFLVYYDGITWNQINN